MLRKSDIEAFLSRDWRRVQTLKDAHWQRFKHERGIEGVLAVTSALAEQARLMRPGWPTRSDREHDFETHCRVSAAPARTRRPR